MSQTNICDITSFKVKIFQGTITDKRGLLRTFEKPITKVSSFTKIDSDSQTTVVYTLCLGRNFTFLHFLIVYVYIVCLFVFSVHRLKMRIIKKQYLVTVIDSMCLKFRIDVDVL